MHLAISEAIDRFHRAVEGFAGARLPDAPAHAWRKFASLGEDAQKAIVQGIHAQAGFAEAAMAEGLEAANEAAMLNWARARLGLLVDNHVTSDVAPGDVVEIFDRNHIQIYRSFSCFALCNYSLLELASYPWFELYERCSSITNMFLELMPKIHEGGQPYVSYSDLGEYTLRELMTDNRTVFGVKEKFMAKMVSSISADSFILSVKRIREFPSHRTDTTVRFL